MRTLVVWAFCFGVMLHHSATAQSGRDLGWLQGKVVDKETGEPLFFVHIDLVGVKDTCSTQTDFDGLFVVRFPQELISLKADLDGYLTYRNQVDLTKGMVDLEIRLERMQQKP
ncbi:MAG: carboxypeptidase-like regulatory domain-containing protein [Flavobacteriales bacterium]|nr:carboxypeptidase-like regulatory domain-containing protein [Flavobacteriales bacterium]MBK9287171.1 carboxypeptidase-like regulatory domain-containing protein [Flavobacteriales bacterium]MBL0034235.1 carboxypeptidase-like regulatory domain-containing protein [Flavobacteriales bacterium]